MITPSVRIKNKFLFIEQELINLKRYMCKTIWSYYVLRKWLRTAKSNGTMKKTNSVLGCMRESRSKRKGSTRFIERIGNTLHVMYIIVIPDVLKRFNLKGSLSRMQRICKSLIVKCLFYLD